MRFPKVLLTLLLAPLGSSVLASDEETTVSPVHVLSPELSLELVAFMEGDETSVAQSWEFPSLSCISMPLEEDELAAAQNPVQEAVNEEAEALILNYCSLKLPAGGELVVPVALSTQLIQNLELLGVVPFSVPENAIRMYTMKTVRCERIVGESQASAQCTISSEIAFPFGGS